MADIAYHSLGSHCLLREQGELPFPSGAATQKRFPLSRALDDWSAQWNCNATASGWRVAPAAQGRLCFRMPNHSS